MVNEVEDVEDILDCLVKTQYFYKENCAVYFKYFYG